MSFLDVAKNQITSQIAGRVNKAIHGGLKNVSGNLPGSSVGKGSNSSNSAAMQQKTRFTTKNITYPINVEGDPMQGHYIMFMINAGATFIALFISIVTFYVVKARDIKASWGDTRYGILSMLARFSILHLDKNEVDIKNWLQN